MQQFNRGDRVIVTALKPWLQKKLNVTPPISGILTAISGKAVLLDTGSGVPFWVPFSASEIIPEPPAGLVIHTSDVPDIPLVKTKAWDHQKRAYWFAEGREAVMWAMGMGCGKSKTTVDYHANQGFKKSLILCPSSVIDVWPGEFDIHSPVPVEVVALRKGSTVAKKTQAARQAIMLAQQRKKPVVLVINYESAWREEFADFALAQKWDLVALDESQRIKSPSGRASKFCAQLGKVAQNRLCLTGTPMPHSPLDIYAQFRFLDPRVFGNSYVRFRNRYAMMGRVWWA